MMRLFVALPVPEPLVEALEVVQSSLPKGLRPVPAADFHVTLAFLGEVGRSETEDMIAAVEGLTGDAVKLEVTGISTFGAGDETRSLHASLAANPELIARQREILGMVRAIGIQPARRRFVPHITLARRKPGPADALFLGWLARHTGWSAPCVTGETVTLFASTLTPDGSRYEALAEAYLGYSWMAEEADAWT